jgi:hypothetical protein
MPELATIDAPAEAQTATSTLAVLKATEAWLSDPERWTTGAFALDAEGNELGSAGIRLQRHNVRSACGVGAIMLNTSSMCDSPYYSAVDALREELGDRPITKVNDGPDGYKRIMAGLRRAITKLEAAA